MMSTVFFLVVGLFGAGNLVGAYPSEDATLIASVIRNTSLTGKCCPQANLGKIPVLASTNPSKACQQPGEVRFLVASKVAQLCTGSEWVNITTESDGTAHHPGPSEIGLSESHPARSCLHIRELDCGRPSGSYWIKHPGYTGSAYIAYCDMYTEGGGWTLFATKLSPDFAFLSTAFTSSSANSVDGNGAGCIPITDWNEVLFRFRHDNGAARVVYNRQEGGPSQETMDTAVDCRSPPGHIVRQVGGFVKHTPYENNGRRLPDSGYHTIQALHFHPGFSGISENHAAGSNVWLDLWNGKHLSSKYRSDNPEAEGRKCIAGVCYLDQTVWLMYR